MAKVESDEELSQSEFVQFRSLTIASLNAFENLYTQASEVADAVALEEIGEMVAAFLTIPANTAIWEQQSTYFGGKFRNFVAERIVRIDNAEQT